jgi:hypothetical protein
MGLPLATIEAAPSTIPARPHPTPAGGGKSATSSNCPRSPAPDWRRDLWNENWISCRNNSEKCGLLLGLSQKNNEPKCLGSPQRESDRAYFLSRRIIPMTVPVGTWNVVTDKHSSTLVITNVDPQGKITGTIQTSATETHNISGTWDGVQLTFTYTLTLGAGPYIPFPVTFTGFWFHGASGGLFMKPPGPVAGPYSDLLAGTFHHLFALPTGHPNGWVARLA